MNINAGNDICHELHRKFFTLGHGRWSAFVEDPKTALPRPLAIPDFHSFIPLLERYKHRVLILRKYAVRFFPDAKPWEFSKRYRPDLGRETKKVVAKETDTGIDVRRSPFRPPLCS